MRQSAAIRHEQTGKSRCMRLSARRSVRNSHSFCTTGVVAQKLKRRWIVSDRSLEYLTSGRIRFESAAMSTMPVAEVSW